MKIFNEEIIDEINESLKNLGEKIKNIGNKENVIKKCPNCGASLDNVDEERIKKCPYCGSEFKKRWFED